jgi:hypothetical protein
LRRLAQEIASCATSGDDPGALLARQSDLERQARERAWQAAGVKATRDMSRPMRLTDLFAALGEAALVEFADVDGDLHAIVAAGGRCYHHVVAPVQDVRHELGHVRLALRRLAYGGTHAALGSGAEAQLARAVARLDRLFMAPIARLLGSRPVVIVPTGELHATPWAALPTLAGRPVSVAPSARLWLGTTSSEPGPGEPPNKDALEEQALKEQHGARPFSPRRPHLPRQAKRRSVVIAGPGLAGAEHEASAIGSLYPSAQVLSGDAAQVAAVLAILEGASIAHIAAHASFRADNGLWSSLQLADGVLTVYELEQLRRPPEVVVLSACQSGLSAVRPGDEVMGLVAALLTLGAKSVVASVVPVEDAASEQLMVALHQRLLAGDAPAVALAEAQSVTPGTVSLSYVCFGGG